MASLSAYPCVFFRFSFLEEVVNLRIFLLFFPWRCCKTLCLSVYFDFRSSYQQKILLKLFVHFVLHRQLWTI
jgi:hypothetical protein